MKHFPRQKVWQWAFAIWVILEAAMFTACGTVDDKAAASSAGSISASKEQIDKPLVIYFSRGINTVSSKDVDAVTGPSLKADGTGFHSDEQTLAEWIAEETNGDLFAIRTIKKYPTGYDEILEAGKQEKMRDDRPHFPPAWRISMTTRGYILYTRIGGETCPCRYILSSTAMIFPERRSLPL